MSHSKGQYIMSVSLSVISLCTLVCIDVGEKLKDEHSKSIA